MQGGDRLLDTEDQFDIHDKILLIGIPGEQLIPTLPGKHKGNMICNHAGKKLTERVCAVQRSIELYRIREKGLVREHPLVCKKIMTWWKLTDPIHVTRKALHFRGEETCAILESIIILKWAKTESVTGEEYSCAIQHSQRIFLLNDIENP